MTVPCGNHSHHRLSPLLLLLTLTAVTSAPSLGTLWQSGPVTDKNLFNPKYFVPSDNAQVLEAGWNWTSISNVTYPMTTQISTVRLLGGWTTAMANSTTPETEDVVFRNASTGELQYREDLLFRRLDRWVDAGIKLTVVLDNVPYALSTQPPTIGTYGITSGPANFTEYRSFITTLTRLLLARYGADTVSTWRWRVATEPNNAGGHWSAGLDSFVSTYKAVVAGLRSALPHDDFIVGPGNIAPENHSNPVNRYASPFVDGLQAAFAADKDNMPIGFVAASYYGGCGHHPTYSSYHPVFSLRAALFLQSFAKAAGASPDIPKEFMEYGNLGDCQGNINSDPGTFGAAWRVATAALAVEHGVERLFHWSRFSELGRPNEGLLFPGGRWLAAVAHQLANVTDLKSLSGALTPVPDLSSETAVNAVGAFGLMATSASPDTPDPFIVTVFAANRTLHPDTPVTLNFDCPRRWMAADGSCSVGTVLQLGLNQTSAPFDVLFSDLRKMNALAYPKDLTPMSYPKVATPAGRTYVETHMEHYLGLQASTFRPTSFEGHVECDGTSMKCTAKWTAACPPITILLAQ